MPETQTSKASDDYKRDRVIASKREREGGRGGGLGVCVGGGWGGNKTTLQVQQNSG